MITEEQVLSKIQDAIALNKRATANCNEALTEAKNLVAHYNKDIREELEKEYFKGFRDAWRLIKQLENIEKGELMSVFGLDNIPDIVGRFQPWELKEKIAARES